MHALTQTWLYVSSSFVCVLHVCIHVHPHVQAAVGHDMVPKQLLQKNTDDWIQPLLGMGGSPPYSMVLTWVNETASWCRILQPPTNRGCNGRSTSRARLRRKRLGAMIPGAEAKPGIKVWLFKFWWIFGIIIIKWQVVFVNHVFLQSANPHRNMLDIGWWEVGKPSCVRWTSRCVFNLGQKGCYVVSTGISGRSVFN